MRDLAEKWSVAPDWQSAVITAPGLVVRAISDINQLLVSGDLDAWARVSGVDGTGVGAFGATQGDRYAARLARDRLLAVSNSPLAIAKGWLPESVPQAGLQSIVFGFILVGFIIFEPYGLYGRWVKIRTYFDVFPFYRRGTFRRQRSYLRSERLR